MAEGGIVENKEAKALVVYTGEVSKGRVEINMRRVASRVTSAVVNTTFTPRTAKQERKVALAYGLREGQEE